MGTSSQKLSYPLDLVSLRAADSAPLHRQLYEQLRDLILQGALSAGTKLPSIRAIAGELAVSRNTVVSALEQLSAEGLVESRSGAGTQVARATLNVRSRNTPDGGGTAGLSTRGKVMTSQPRVRTVPRQTAFHPGTPELAQFPFKTWSRLLARRARFSGEDLFGYHYIAGHPELREAIARFLSTMRRVRCTPDQIVVTTGGQAALDLLARLLLDEGDSVWMEEPGYLGARGAFLGAGARLYPLPVDRGGWRVPKDLPSPRLIYLTPSCQHPLGITMPIEQRLAILEVAKAAGAWVIEDDFDGEYTFRGQPLPSMQGLTENQQIIYVGTFAKILFPAMRLGFMVLPSEISERIRPAISLTGQYAPLGLQAALADFIEEGYFFRHLNRMRRLYASRRAFFLELLEEHLGDYVEPIDGRTGIQLAVPFSTDIDDRKVMAKAEAAGVNLAALSLYFVEQPKLRGLLMGYAGVPESEMLVALPALRTIITAVAVSDAPRA